MAEVQEAAPITTSYLHSLASHLLALKECQYAWQLAPQFHSFGRYSVFLTLNSNLLE